jgi:hypothetical protein
MAGDVTYRIRDWEKHFECAQSRKNSGPLKWVTLPTAHDGGGFKRLMKQPNGTAIYGAWCLILGVAAKCPKRGVLESNNGPLTATDLEIKTDSPAELFEEAFRVLSDGEIGIRWMESNQPKKPKSGSVVVDHYHTTTTPLPLLEAPKQDSSGASGQITTYGESGSVVGARSQIATTPVYESGLRTYGQTDIQTGEKPKTETDSPDLVSTIVDEFSHLPPGKAQLARAFKAGQQRDPETSISADQSKAVAKGVAAGG